MAVEEKKGLVAGETNRKRTAVLFGAQNIHFTIFKLNYLK